MALITTSYSPSKQGGGSRHRRGGSRSPYSSDESCSPVTIQVTRHSSPKRSRTRATPGKQGKSSISHSPNKGYAYPLCLSFRFLFLATLVTCWVGFFQNYLDVGSHGDITSERVWNEYAGGIEDRYETAPKRQTMDGLTHERDQSATFESAAVPASTDVASTHDKTFENTSIENEGDTAATNTKGPKIDQAEKNDEEEEEEEDDIDMTVLQFVENRILIAPGELPGYTGWARPEQTLAGDFQITAVSEMKGKVKEEWFVEVECMADACQHGGSLFYLRAYGPSIITGEMEDKGDGIYRAVFYPIDPGRYTIEVVLEFSQHPGFESFPVGQNDTEVAYEGWLLPGFPMQVTFEEDDVEKEETKQDSKDAATTSPPARYADDRKWCDFDDLIETDTHSGRSRGRWKVSDNVRTKYHRQITPDGAGVTYLGYQHGLNSLGVKLKYDNIDCKMLTYARANRDVNNVHIMDRCLGEKGIAVGSPQPQDQIHVIFVGCSVMRLMHSSFNFLLRKSNTTNIKTTLVDIRKGLFRTLPHMKDRLTNFTQENPEEKRFIVFNSGLHDIDRLCSQKMWAARIRDQNLTKAIIPDGEPCVKTYRRLFTEMTRFIGDYPAELKVFRTTTPGWMKYGNFGFSWPTDMTQPFQRSHHMSNHLNEIAVDVLGKEEKAKGIHIMDGFWTSLARPDNTEVGPTNYIGKHMVHPGVEVMDAMARKWMQIIVRSTCSGALDD